MEKKLTDTSAMPFGKHKGLSMANVPADYLLYLYKENKLTPAVKLYIEENMDFLKEEAKK